MTIIVKKVPKFLRGFVKFIFGIKDNTQEENQQIKRKKKRKKYKKYLPKGKTNVII